MHAVQWSFISNLQFSVKIRGFLLNLKFVNEETKYWYCHLIFV